MNPTRLGGTIPSTGVSGGISSQRVGGCLTGERLSGGVSSVGLAGTIALSRSTIVLGCPHVTATYRPFRRAGGLLTTDGLTVQEVPAADAVSIGTETVMASGLVGIPTGGVAQLLDPIIRFRWSATVGGTVRWYWSRTTPTVGGGVPGDAVAITGEIPATTSLQDESIAGAPPIPAGTGPLYLILAGKPDTAGTVSATIFDETSVDVTLTF